MNGSFADAKRLKACKRERESRFIARKEERTGRRLLRLFNYLDPYKIILIIAKRGGGPERVIAGNETCSFRNDYRFKKKSRDAYKKARFMNTPDGERAYDNGICRLHCSFNWLVFLVLGDAPVG